MKHIAQNNGFPLGMIHQLHDKKKQPSTQSTHPQTYSPNSWISFLYCSLLTSKVTNLFKNTHLKIMFHTRCTIYNLLQAQKEKTERKINTHAVVFLI